jgi:hypothetical protein
MGRDVVCARVRLCKDEEMEELKRDEDEDGGWRENKKKKGKKKKTKKKKKKKEKGGCVCQCDGKIRKWFFWEGKQRRQE